MNERSTASRCEWLPPWFVALTDADGRMIAADWKKISAVAEHSSGCALVLIDGCTAWEHVKESPAQVFAEITRASS